MTVILVIIIFVLALLLVASIETQRSLQWWQNRQSIHLHQAAEEIRNGILQKSFSLRRTLEVTPDVRAELTSDWLKALEDLHHDFDRLSDRLSPPGLEDSLPTAIYYQSKQWQVDYPEWEFKLDLPDRWMPETCEQGRVILTALDELFRSILPHNSPDKSVSIGLKGDQSIGELKVQIPTQTDATLNSSDLRHLAHAFSALTTGTFTHQTHGNQLVSHFHWKTAQKLQEN